jgi:hypothetical protein
MSRELKPRWWCIQKECNHYASLRCAHKDIEKLTGKKMLRIKNLQMCPVLTDAEACIINFNKENNV